MAEISLSALAHKDLDRAIRDVEAMLGAVRRTDKYTAAGYTALVQLAGERSRRTAAWPQEHPKRR